LWRGVPSERQKGVLFRLLQGQGSTETTAGTHAEKAGVVLKNNPVRIRIITGFQDPKTGRVMLYITRPDFGAVNFNIYNPF
jgi:hypothetical protein